MRFELRRDKIDFFLYWCRIRRNTDRVDLVETRNFAWLQDYFHRISLHVLFGENMEHPASYSLLGSWCFRNQVFFAGGIVCIYPHNSTGVEVLSNRNLF
ncbi:hypothetical protein D3C87_1667400 [compost metagenome]